MASVGYVEEEYSVSGSAKAYRPTRPLTPDGLWEVEAVDTAPFTTRIIVRRPTDPARFNGTVLCEWNNVTAGFDLLVNSETSTLYDGFAFVGVTTQYVGAVGLASSPAGLKAWDPERYADVVHPGDAYSYDMFTQVARLVGPGRTVSGVDPLGGLTVRNVIGNGASQSAGRLLTYINAIQPIERAFDGFLATVGMGRGAGFDNAILDPELVSTLSPAELETLLGTATTFRNDLDVPVMQVNTECEVLMYARARQPDTELFRYWEVAGASHAPAPLWADIARAALRDFGVPLNPPGDLVDSTIVQSTVDWRPVFGAALVHVKHWIEDGQAPPTQNLIELTPEGAVARDELGNAKGGVRLPDVEVPIAAFDGGGVGPETIGLGGSTTELTSAQLASMYSSPEDYVSRVAQAAESAQDAGVIEAWRTAEYVANAQEAAPSLFQVAEATGSGTQHTSTR